MTEQKYIELYSKSRIKNFGGIDEHEANFDLIDKISSKLGRIEIIIRNKIDRTMRQKDEMWLYHLPPHIVLDDNNGECSDHDTLVSRQTFGFWIKVAKHYKIENTIFEKDFLENFSFKNYSLVNKDKAGKDPLRYWQKALILLQLLKNIRNRAFHFENLLKFNTDGKPRMNARLDFKNAPAIISIEPNKLKTFLDDILKSFDKDLVK